MMVLSLSALINACSSTTEPRAMLMRMPSGPRAACDRLTDGAHSDHANGPVPQRRAGKMIGALHPLARPQIALGLRKFAHRAQEQTERGVGDLLGQDLGRIRHGHRSEEH